MPDSHHEKEDGTGKKGGVPGAGNVAEAVLEQPGHNHYHPLPEHRCDAVEGAPDAHEKALPVFIQRQHIVSVRGYVVRGGEHCGDVEEDQGEGEGPDGFACTMRQREGDGGEADGHQRLHHHYPPALGAHHVHQRTPEGFYHPREIEEAGIHRKVGVAHAHTLEHGDRHHVDYEIGYALREV